MRSDGCRTARNFDFNCVAVIIENEFAVSVDKFSRGRLLFPAVRPLEVFFRAVCAEPLNVYRQRFNFEFLGCAAGNYVVAVVLRRRCHVFARIGFYTEYGKSIRSAFYNSLGRVCLSVVYPNVNAVYKLIVALCTPFDFDSRLFDDERSFRFFRIFDYAIRGGGHACRVSRRARVNRRAVYD